jgi:PAS domain S-box-containing protein
MANTPARPLKVLLVEDNSLDSLLIIEELRAGGFDPQWTRVESQAALLARLDEGFDIVLTDYRVPGWDVVTALREMRARNLDVPVIVVSGSIGEEQAVETLQEGAVDYVWKDRLRRLSDAVSRALERKAAERALKESELRYRSVFEANPVPMWVFDHETFRFLDVNDAAIDHYGYTRQEFLQMTIQDIRRPEDQAALAAGLADAPASGSKQTSGEFCHRKKDGTIIDVHVASHGMTFLGRPARVVLSTDITERKAGERAVRESEERFRRIAETVSEVFWIADTDLAALVYVSPAYEQIWGRPVQSLYARPGSFLDSIHPDDRAHAVETLQKQNHGETFEHEYRIVRPDGDIRWIWDRGYPIRDKSGRATQYVGAAQDITPMRRAQEALRQGEEQTRLALKASRVGVWEADLWSGGAYWSEMCEEIHGLAPGSFGKTFEAFTSLIHPDDCAQVVATVDRAIRNRSQADLEYRTRKPQ